MNKHEYIIYLITNNLLVDEFYACVSCLLKIHINQNKNDVVYDGSALTLVDGSYVFKNIEGDIIKLTDTYTTDEPLYLPTDGINITKVALPLLKKDTIVTLGHVLINHLVVDWALKGKIDYIFDNAITPKTFEKAFTPLMGDVEPMVTKDNLNSFYLVVKYLEHISHLVTYSATLTNIVPPEGLKEKKKALLLKYDTNDPVQQVEFREELKEWFVDQLKDDPSYDKLLRGKTLTRALRMLALYGSEEVLGGEMSDFIPDSLADGLPTDAKTFADTINISTAGSDNRGTNTQLGGVVYEYISKATTGLSIAKQEVGKTDCGSKGGRTITLTKDTLKRYIDEGRYFVNTNGKPSLLTSPGDYTLRSPIACKQGGVLYCEICMGDKLSKSVSSITEGTGEIPRQILAYYMGAVHGRTVENVTISSLSHIF